MKAGAAKLKDKFGRKKDQPAGSAAGPEHERRAIADADQMLSAKPTSEDASSRLPAISRRHGVPLRLVRESKDAGGEHVRVQTMATNSHNLLTGGAYDPTKRTVDQLWHDCEPTNAFPGETPADAPTRVAAAKARLRQLFSNYKVAYLDAVTAHKGGVDPRSFTSVAQEDFYGGHTTKKHVKGMRLMAQGKEDLALRVVRGLPGESPVPQASYFEDLAEANAAAELAITTDWSTLRAKIAAGKQKVERPVAVGHVGFALKENPAMPTLQLPSYLGGPYPGPLYPGDPRAQNSSLPPVTIVTAVAGAMVVVRPDPSKPGGWYVFTAFPK